MLLRANERNGMITIISRVGVAADSRGPGCHGVFVALLRLEQLCHQQGDQETLFIAAFSSHQQGEPQNAHQTQGLPKQPHPTGWAPGSGAWLNVPSRTLQEGILGSGLHRSCPGALVPTNWHPWSLHPLPQGRDCRQSPFN